MAISTIGSLKLSDVSNLNDPKILKKRWFTQSKMSLFMSLPCIFAAVALSAFAMENTKLYFLSVVCLVLGGYFLIEPFTTPLWKLIKRKTDLKQAGGKIIGFSRMRESPRYAVNALIVFTPEGAAKVEFSEIYSWQGFPRGNHGQGGRFVDPISVQVLYDPDDVKCAAVAGITPDSLAKINDENLKPLQNHSAA